METHSCDRKTEQLRTTDQRVATLWSMKLLTFLTFTLLATPSAADEPKPTPPPEAIVCPEPCAACGKKAAAAVPWPKWQVVLVDIGLAVGVAVDTAPKAYALGHEFGWF